MKLEVLRPLETTWEDWVLGGGLLEAFADPSLPLAVEIGPGDDDYLLERAAADPVTNWLGIEYSRKRVRRYVRRVQQRVGEPGNLRLAWRPAIDVVGPFLTPSRVDAYHVYFPDPWPKKHHHRYRLLTPAFLGDLRESLKPGGTVYLATDHREYAEEIVAAFGEAGGYRSAHPRPGYVMPEAGSRATVFEERWRTMGRVIHQLEFRRVANA